MKLYDPNMLHPYACTACMLLVYVFTQSWAFVGTAFAGYYLGLLLAKQVG